MGRHIAFYGLSSELLNLSSRIPGSEGLYFVDEVLGAAYSAADLRRSSQLDSLTPMTSLEEAIGSSSDVVFAPRYRSIENPEARLQEIRSHLEVLAPFLGKKTVINALPVGLGENAQMEEFLSSRMDAKPVYIYAPIEPNGAIKYVGAHRDQVPKWLLEVTRGEVMDIEDVEAAHINNVLSQTVPLLVRGVAAQGPPVGYVQEAFSGALEAFLVGATADPGSSAYSVYSLVRRSFDEYAKRLIAALKEAIRGSGMKISRARIAVLWTLDEGSARGDELWAFERLREALASTFVDLNFMRSDRLLQMERKDVALICTKLDEDAFSRRRFEGRVVVRMLYPRPEVVQAH
jgi:hypothetical protein